MKSTIHVLTLRLLTLSLNAQAQSQHPASIPYGNNPTGGIIPWLKEPKFITNFMGKGKPFVHLHGGIMGSTGEMAQSIDSLSKTYQVIAVSTRGHGRSEIGHTPVTYEQKANNIRCYQCLNQRQREVLGFSNGAYTGYKLVSMYPARVKKLIAIGAGEQVPGLRKVVFVAKEIFRQDSVYWKKRLSVYPNPKGYPNIGTTWPSFIIA